MQAGRHPGIHGKFIGPNAVGKSLRPLEPVKIHRHLGQRDTGINGGRPGLKMEIIDSRTDEQRIDAKKVVVLKCAGGIVQVVGVGIVKRDIVFDDSVRSPIDVDPRRSKVIVVNGVIQYLGIGRSKVDDDAPRVIPDDIVVGQIAVAIREKDPSRAVVAENAVVVHAVVADDVVAHVCGVGAAAVFVEVDTVAAVVVHFAAIDEIVVGIEV